MVIEQVTFGIAHKLSNGTGYRAVCCAMLAMISDLESLLGLDEPAIDRLDFPVSGNAPYLGQRTQSGASRQARIGFATTHPTGSLPTK
jgi:hypothetical protein